MDGMRLEQFRNLNIYDVFWTNKYRDSSICAGNWGTRNSKFAQVEYQTFSLSKFRITAIKKKHWEELLKEL